jgi:flagellar export protein FliJ
VKKFTFRLEKALKIRSWTESEARIELGRAVGELSVLEKSIAENVGAREAAASKRFSDGHSIDDYRLYDHYIERLDEEREALLKQASAAELKVEEARGLWTEAKAELKATENVKEKRFAEYRKDFFAEEEKQNDGLIGKNTRSR